MDRNRRSFLAFLLSACAVLAESLYSLPGFAYECFARHRRIRPTLLRMIGITLLPGGGSTAMLVGKNLHTVDAVLFDSRDISAEIITRDPTHLILRIRTSEAWQSAMVRLMLQARTEIVAIDLRFAADPSRLQGPYGQYSYGRYGSRYSANLHKTPAGSAPLEQDAQGTRFESGFRDRLDIEYDVPLCIGGHLI
jgi:hypothetical protein